MKKLLNNQTFQQIFCTKIGWLLICVIGTVVFGCLSTHSTVIKNGFVWCDYAAILCLSYIVILGLIEIAFAWIINPYKAWKENKK